MNGNVKDLRGKRFGSFTVIGISKRRSPKGIAYWRCRCDCGRLLDVRGDNLRNGNSTQCTTCYGRGRESAFVITGGGDE